MRKHMRGITLMELMIVVVIIGNILSELSELRRESQA